MSMHTDIVVTLQGLRTLITPDHRFTRDTFARTAQGHAVEPTDPAAVAWCMRGALVHAVASIADGIDTPRYHALHAAAHQLLTVSAQHVYQMGGLAQINDDRGHTAVLTIIDAALDRLEQDARRCA